MFKKLLAIIGFFCAVCAIYLLIQSGYEETILGDLIAEYFLIYALVWGIIGLIFGFITLYVSESKGYSGGFAWGFWLGIIGLLVVGFKPNKKRAVKHKPVPNSNLSGIEILEKLANLHQQGLLTDEEFQRKKAEILNRM